MRLSRRYLPFAALSLPSLLSGCAARATTGYVRSIGQDDPAQAVAISVHADYAYFGPAMRTKWGPDLRSGALAVEAGLPPGTVMLGPATFIAVAGVHVFQVDNAQGERSFGMGSPYFSAGPTLCPGLDADATEARPGVHCLSALSEVDHHVRFGAPDQAYWTLGISYMYVWCDIF